MKKGIGVSSFLAAFLLTGSALAQSNEEKFSVGIKFFQAMLSAYYAPYFISECELYAIDELGDEYLVLFENISPYDSYFDRSSTELYFVSEGDGGIFVSESPDKTEREVNEVSFLIDKREIEKLTEPELDSLDTNLVLVLEFFRDTCRSMAKVTPQE